MLAGVPLAFPFRCPAGASAGCGREGTLMPLAGSLEPVALTGSMSISRCSGPFVPRYGMLTASVLWRRQMVLKSGTTQSRPVSRKRLSTKPPRHGHSDQWRFHGSICRSAIPNSTFMVRHVWIAASLNVCDLPLLPEGLAAQFISGSNQPYGDCQQSPTGQWIVNEPRRLSAALYAAQFVVL